MNQKTNALITIDIKLRYQVDPRRLARLLLVGLVAALKLWFSAHPLAA